MLESIGAYDEDKETDKCFAAHDMLFRILNPKGMFLIPYKGLQSYTISC